MVVYADDEFEYEIVDGEIKVAYHKQKLSNVDPGKIVAAYAILTYPDGAKENNPHDYGRNQKGMGARGDKGKNEAHTNFTAEMCKKTVINRACKKLASSHPMIAVWRS